MATDWEVQYATATPEGPGINVHDLEPGRRQLSSLDVEPPMAVAHEMVGLIEPYRSHRHQLTVGHTHVRRRPLVIDSGKITKTLPLPLPLLLLLLLPALLLILLIRGI